MRITAGMMLVSGLLGLAVQAQQPGMPPAQVVVLDTVPAARLEAAGRAWLVARQWPLTTDSATADGRVLVAEPAFLVYASGYVSKTPSGQVRGRVRIETKPGKYRYQFDDFVFHYYKQDRQGRFMPTGKTKPLTEPTASGWQRTWESHRRTTRDTAEAWGRQLEAAMRQPPPATKPPVPAPNPEQKW